MPASPSLVSIDHAKCWAKRLHKTTPALGSLSQAQEAVAKMLGHASWHALTAFYANQLTSTPNTTEPERTPKGTDDAFGFGKAVDLINQKFPGIDARRVESLGSETEEIETDSQHIVDRFMELEREGYFPETALEMALEESTQRVHAPPGHIMIRVRDAQGQAVTVLLNSQEYRQAVGV